VGAGVYGAWERLLFPEASLVPEPSTRGGEKMEKKKKEVK
jgi:hypothetical protein